MNIQDTHATPPATLSPRVPHNSAIAQSQPDTTHDTEAIAPAALTAPLTLQRLEQLLKDLQRLQEEHHSHHHHTQRVVQGLNQSFTQHLHTLNRLWSWGEEHDIGDLPSFSEWLETPVEPTLTSWPDMDIISGVNPLDTQVLMEHGWQKRSNSSPTNSVSENSAQAADSVIGGPRKAGGSGKKSATGSRETGFQSLLRNLLDQVDQCRELLATIDLIQTRSHQTDQTQDHHLQHTEDVLAINSLKAFDTFFQELQEHWVQKATTANCPLTLVVPEQETHIWIEAKAYDALFKGFLDLLDIWLKLWQEKNVAITNESSPPSESRTAPIINLKLQIQGKSLILKWEETTSMHEAVVMDITRLQEAWVGMDSPWSIDMSSESDSESSHHTQAMLQMPLAPARCQQLICRVSNDLYSLSLDHMEQLILPKADQLKMATGGVLMLTWQINQQDELLRIYPLSQLIQYSHSAPWVGHQHRQSVEASDAQSSSSQTQATPIPSSVSLTSPSPILLLHISQQWVGIMVNEVVAEKMVLLRPLGNAIAAPPWIQGCSLVHEHQLALAIDLELLLRQAVGFGL